MNYRSKPIPTHLRSRLLEVLDYSRSDGTFRWKVATARKIKVGQVAGSPDKDGYILIRFDNRRYSAHRLAWLYVHGDWPGGGIDHIDGNPANNRIENLRLATVSQNIANAKRPCTNTSGYKGVTQDKRSGKWVAQIQCERIGSFNSARVAHQAYINEARRRFGDFARAE